MRFDEPPVRIEHTYWHALDKEVAKNYQLPPAQLGISTPPMKDQLAALKARIFQGASHVELGFTGREKGSMAQSATTPEMFGKEEREAMRQLAKINEVSISTHATLGVTGLAGLAQRQFDEGQREKAIIEVKRAMDFAADVAEGGPVVVHTGEFPRPVHGVEGEKFMAFPLEPQQKAHFVVDKKTGELMAIREDSEVFELEYEKDERGNYKLDEHGRKIPIRDELGRFKVIKKTFQDYVKEAEEYNKKHRYGPGDPNYLTPEELFYRAQAEYQWEQAEGQADEYERHYKEALKTKEKVKEALKYWEEIEKKIPEKDKWKIAKTIIHDKLGILPPETKTPTEFLKEILWDAEKTLSYGREVAASARKTAARYKDMAERIISIDKYALEKSADSLARLGVYAAEKQKHQGLKKDLFVAPENAWSPEIGYGAHPQELKKIVQKARERMVELLTKPKVKTIEGFEVDNPYYRPGMSKSAAEKEAERHIKATFDIGHAATWRKFFKGSDKEFNKWLIKQYDDLAKAGVIGHIHLSDNFGYYDEHTTPGQGNVPLKEFVEHVKKHQPKQKIVVEPAHQDYLAMLGAWKHLQSPLYRIDGASRTWTEIEHSYFGLPHSPRYVVGDYAPDPKTWIFWSEVPLE